ncbi:MAG: DUF4157 domain-containing protein [Nostocaceae cyanobacterium]|nr:DUF4157 domain-containing protein [Nostocaceae cyanobacterium]
MNAADKVHPSITTIGENWRDKANLMIQQRRPQRCWDILLENNFKNIHILQEKWQGIDTDNRPKSPWVNFAENIHKKYTSKQQNVKEHLLPTVAEEIDSSEEYADKLRMQPQIQFRKDNQLLQHLSREYIPNKQIEQENNLLAESQGKYTRSHQGSQANNLENRELNFNQSPRLAHPQKNIISLKKQSEIAQGILSKYSAIKPRFTAALPTLDKTTQQSQDFPNHQDNIDAYQDPENRLQRNYAESQDIQEKIEKSSHSPINFQLKNFLSEILHIRVPNVKVYANQAADTLANNFNADALTYDNKIMFRTGKYNPQNPESIALLGHEFTHITSSPNLNNSDEAEEQTAVNNENRVRRYFSLPEIQRGNQQLSAISTRNNHTQTSSLAQTSIPAPKTASAISQHNLTSEGISSMSISSQMKEEMFKEFRARLLEEIKTTSERGG